MLAFVRILTAIIVSGGVLISACGGSDDEETSGGFGVGAGPVSETFDEGTVRMEIEFLDTGLLKGHAYADAAEGWKVARISVSAVDHEGSSWTMIEPPGEQVGFGTETASEFFEVRLEELPRGEQLAITQTVVFEDETGTTAERSVEDRWPP